MSILGIVAEDICNQAIDLVGGPVTITDLQDGSDQARVFLRHYAPSVQEISRAARWNFARKEAALTLLQDATGQTPNVGTGTPGMGIWIYEYAWPVDCMNARFVPANASLTTPIPAGNISVPPNVPATTGQALQPYARTLPTPFLVTQDQVPNLVGVPTSWDDFPDLSGTQGQGLSQQTVILSNVPSASLVYTSLVREPNIWDPLFRQAIVGLLAAKTALRILKDRKEAFAARGIAIQAAKSALEQARLADGNEDFPSSVNREASWIQARTSGIGGSYGNSNDGSLMGCWYGCPFPDGSVY